jgi:hypothetical protein
MAKRCPSCGYGPIGPYIDNCPICAEPVRNVFSDEAAAARPAKKQPLPLWVKVGLVLAVLAVVGYFGLGIVRGLKKGNNAPPIQRPRPDAPADRRVPIVVAAGQLVQEFQNDPVVADQKYQGKLLELTGVVERGGRNRDGMTFVILHARDENAKLKIECFFDLPDKQSDVLIVTLRKGETITVRGEYDGQVSNLQLWDCVLVK